MQPSKNGARAEGADTVIAAKVYPRPTRERSWISAGERGELVHTKLNEPGSPEVVALNTGSGVVPWWVVLGVEVA